MFDSFYFEEEQKSMRTAFLMTALTVLLVLVGDYFGGARGMMMMLIISLAMNLFSYWNSDKLVLAQYNAKQVDEKSAPALYKMVQRLAERGNLPMPKVYIIDSPVPNAFATGRNPEHAAVAVTTALANALDKDEIEGVLAHELSHVKHGDILIGTIAASMAGIITTLSHWGMFFGGVCVHVILYSLICSSATSRISLTCPSARE